MSKTSSAPITREPLRSVEEQIAYVLHGPPEFREPPLRRGPAEPLRTVAEQLAALGYPQLTPHRDLVDA